MQPSAINPTAAKGFALRAEEYERARPLYPQGLVDTMLQTLGLTGDRGLLRVLELAAGTGKFTRSLVSAGLETVATEPLPQMFSELRANLPEVPVVASTAESIPFGSDTFDVVVAAQAFHWFDPKVAHAECARVLRPGGGLALIWNVRDDSYPWIADLKELIDKWDDQIPRHEHRAWDEDAAAHHGFASLGRIDVVNLQPMDLGRLVERVVSTSFIATLDEETRKQVIEQVESLVNTHPDLAGKQSFMFPYRTELFCLKPLR